VAVPPYRRSVARYWIRVVNVQVPVGASLGNFNMRLIQLRLVAASAVCRMGGETKSLAIVAAASIRFRPRVVAGG
jgi:hypothetical protein